METGLKLNAPELLTSDHKLDVFASGVPSLDDWLRRRALHNQLSGASRTYVACHNNIVYGYYALASSAVASVITSGRFRRNMPDPVPVVILARLAVSRQYQVQGIGRALFRDAALRVINAADSIGIRGMLVHAISEEAKAFYIKLGLDVSPLELMTLMTTIAELRLAL